MRCAGWPRSGGWWPDNAWAGTSIGHPRSLPLLKPLLRIPAPKRYLSNEPLLSPLVPGLCLDRPSIGGSSAARVPVLFIPRPDHATPIWCARSAICMSGTAKAFFFKQWGRKDNNPTPWTEELDPRAKGGATLDGRLWREWMSKPPLWVCVHEAGHAIARIQLQTNLVTGDREPAYPITNPAFEEIAVAIDVQVRSGTYWRGWVKNLPDRNLRLWVNEAVACAAGPVADLTGTKEIRSWHPDGVRQTLQASEGHRLGQYLGMFAAMASRSRKLSRPPMDHWGRVPAACRRSRPAATVPSLPLVQRSQRSIAARRPRGHDQHLRLTKLGRSGALIIAAALTAPQPYGKLHY